MAPFVQGMGINHGRTDVFMSEEFLDGLNFVTRFKQMSCKGMSKGVATNMPGMRQGIPSGRPGRPCFLESLSPLTYPCGCRHYLLPPSKSVRQVEAFFHIPWFEGS